ncbi:MAG: hypothetical protein IKT94_04545 [Rikenellaceae bacterium]|nr:hypothetical protein [Rikenellaceae bacterium]
MKKLLLLVCVAFAISSCQTIRNTATHKTVDVQPVGALIADLDVSPTRITYTMKPHRRVRRGGFENVKSTAIREALMTNGGGDVLVGLEVQTKSVGFLWGRKVTSITVSGYPAKYTNFSNPDKEYWTPLGMWLTQDALQKSKSSKRENISITDLLKVAK